MDMTAQVDAGNDVGVSATNFIRRAAGDGPRALPDVPAGEHYRPLTVRRGGDGLASMLGWFSIGLGVAGVAAPDALARLIGVRPTERTRTALRSIGTRELTSGLGILSGQRQADWLWSRVAGDAMDLALLGGMTGSSRNERSRLAGAMVAVAGVTALDLYAAVQVGKRKGSLVQGQPDDNGRGPGAGGGDDFERHRQATRDDDAAYERNTARGVNTGLDGARAKRESGLRRTTNVITVNKSVEAVYDFWHDFENFPRFMRHLESVKRIGDGRTRWRAKAPAGATVEWEAETTEDRPNELISWRSLPGADVRNAGTVRFSSAPGGRGTEVRVDLEYAPPAGKAGALVAMLFREEPGQQVHDDLRAFKQVMELGEIVISDASRHKGMHPAQPSGKTAENRK